MRIVLLMIIYFVYLLILENFEIQNKCTPEERKAGLGYAKIPIAVDEYFEKTNLILVELLFLRFVFQLNNAYHV